MDTLRQRTLLNAGAIGLLIPAAGVVFWSVASPVGSVETRDGPIASAAAPADPSSTETLVSGRQRGSADFDLSLQDPLYDPPPAPEKPKPAAPQPRPRREPPAARLDWKLVGTIIDDDNSVAILTDTSGKTDIRRRGEQVELEPSGVTIDEISAEQVTLDVAGRRSTLRLEKSYDTSGGRRPNRNQRGRNR